jgi:hypothetical protein
MNINKTTEAMRATRGLLLCAATVAALSSVGCASESDQAGESADSEPQALQAGGDEKRIEDPGGSYFASVTANGTGCRPGTWETSIAPDGQTFTTTFSEFETEVNRSSMISVKDCQLNVVLHSPQGLSFAVQDFYYGGYAFLEEDVNLRQIANYYFSGTPNDNAEARTELNGPYDDTYLFEDKRKDVDLVFAPCGTERNLQIRSTMRLRNSSPRRNGYGNLAAIDGKTKLVFKLAWRRCND